MRRIFALLALLPAACTPSPGPSLTAELAGFGRRIEIRARDEQPLAEAVLVLPDGTRVAAERVAGGAVPPAVSVGASGGSGGAGIDLGVGVSLPLGGGRAPGLVESSARIWLPDPAGWPAQAPRSRLELAFGRPPAALRRVELPAPAR